ncbi:hypothetical protein Tco_1468878 [Tanacetum coccineum]
METFHIPFGKEILTVRVTEFEGEIDSLFNGFTLESDDDFYQHDINVEDECQKDSFSAQEDVADSSSLIRRCNYRILTKNNTPSHSDSLEVGNIVDIGNQLGFDMNNKDVDVARILANGDHGGIP